MSQALEVSESEQADKKSLPVKSDFLDLPKPGLMTRFVHKVIPDSGLSLNFLWFVALAAAIFLLQNIQGETTQFYGIAESRQQSISFQYPVEVVEVSIIEGEEVTKASRILKVRRYGLDTELGVLTDKIREIKLEILAQRQSIRAEIKSIQAEAMLKTEVFNTRIGSLESRYRLNQALADALRSGSTIRKAKSSGPVQVELAGIRSEKEKLQALYSARINALNNELANRENPEAAQINELEKQRLELVRQTEALTVEAPFTGSVGSVMSKPGEQVDAFQTLVTLHGTSTGYIKGYIHEAIVNHVRVGQSVWVKRLSGGDQGVLVEGLVESLGSRIVEYPERLKRNTFVSAWGREVIVELDATNEILLGEKVSILIEKPQPGGERLVAMIDRLLPLSSSLAFVLPDKGSKPEDIRESVKKLKKKDIEASGIVRNPAASGYWLISDEHSDLLEMSDSGKVTGVRKINYDQDINDIESISIDGSNIFLLASLSSKNTSPIKPERRRFVRVSLNSSGEFIGVSIDLMDVFARYVDQSTIDNPAIALLRNGIDQNNFDLESHVVRNNKLYVGFKSPLNSRSEAVILEFSDLEALFQGELPVVSEWLSLKLNSPETGNSYRLTDFSLIADTAYLLATDSSSGKVSSAFWRYRMSTGVLELLSTYSGLRAEGLAVSDDEKSAIIVFDGNGKKPSKFLKLDI